jgi:hypothetical protein
MSDLTDVSRKLVAVFAADVEGYSRLMGTDEVGTFRGLTERRTILVEMEYHRKHNLVFLFALFFLMRRVEPSLRAFRR